MEYARCTPVIQPGIFFDSRSCQRRLGGAEDLVQQTIPHQPGGGAREPGQSRQPSKGACAVGSWVKVGGRIAGGDV
jgi:hypothetical protein